MSQSPSRRVAVGRNRGRRAGGRTLVDHFGAGSAAAKAGVRAAYESLSQTPASPLEGHAPSWPFVSDLQEYAPSWPFVSDLQEDAPSRPSVHGHDGAWPSTSRQEQAVRRLTRWLGLDAKRVSPLSLRAALEIYYASVVRLVLRHELGESAVSAVQANPSRDQTDPSRDREGAVRRTTDLLESLTPPHALELDEPSITLDRFGPLYQDLFPRSMRHALGEYYTPDWLAEHVLDVVGYPRLDGNQRRENVVGRGGLRLLDPTCGSGIFLLAAIRRVRAASRSVAPDVLGRWIFENIGGYDVNPLAVLTARANYLLAMGDLLPRGLPCPAPPVQLRDVILDTPDGDAFDYVVGNPPWVAWDDLPGEYRERTKPLWRQYGLFSLSATQARHGGGKKDLSMLVLYRAADRCLSDGGRLGFVITQTLFQTKGAGDGFRRFRLGEEGEPLGVYRVDDLTAARPFVGASNWTAAVALEKGRPTSYPVRYVRWLDRSHRVTCMARPIDPAQPRSPWLVIPKGIDRNLADVTGPSDYTANLGANTGGANGVYWVELVGPVQENRTATVRERPAPNRAATTPTRAATVRERLRTEHAAASPSHALRASGRATPSPGDVCHCLPPPASPTANAPHCLRPSVSTEVSGKQCGQHLGTSVAIPASSGTHPDAGIPPLVAVVRNLSAAGKQPVEQVTVPIEPELLCPLVRWSDLGRWRATPSAYLVLAQDVETRSGIDEATMRRRWPAALAYLARFRDLLARRAAYRRYQSAGPYWSMYNVGPYTLAPIKVVWRRMDRRINAAVVEPVDDPLLGRRPVVVQQTCVQVAVDSLDEAHYLAALLNSSVANFLVTAHSVRGGKGFGTPSMLDYLNLRRFDPNDPRHRRLAELSREAHRLVAEDGETGQVQGEIDRLAARLWGLTQDEALAIEEHMAADC